MKFLNKINRNFFVLLIPVLMTISFAGYFVLRAIIINEAKENLLQKEILIQQQIKKKGVFTNLYPLIEVQKINNKTIERSSFNEVFIYDEYEGEMEPYLEYSNQVVVNGLIYSVKIRQSVFENEDLILLLVLVLFILVFSAFMISFLLTKRTNKTIWQVFEQNLYEIENFSFKSKNKLSFQKSDIEEFDRLNKVINQLTNKLTSDYFILKEFTENASHEIQTPVSVVLLNLEELLQYDLPEDIFQKIATSISALKRLSNLNQSLILLTKIENNQFDADKIISFKEIMNRKIHEFNTLFENLNLMVDFLVKQDFVVQMNEQLSEILINNLLSNAIKHNVQYGKIMISMDEYELKICNTGQEIKLNEENIFNRFTKGNSKSFGLGLAIAKNICDINHLEINYQKTDYHCFTINQNIKK